jgi:Zn-dependent protease
MTAQDGVKVDAPPGAWLALVRDYGVASTRDQELIRARLREGLRARDPEVQAAVDAWEGRAYVHEDDDGVELVLVRRSAPLETRWWLHALLFALTVFTTHMAGALMQGVDPLGTRLVGLGGVLLPVPSSLDPAALLQGSSFAVPFVAILLAHEMGHYLMARRHGVPVTPPFFLPVPAYWSLVGSLGAFIRIRGPMVRRSILLDVGAGGPVVSFLLSLPVAWIGLSLSAPAGLPGAEASYLITFAGQAVWIGDSLAFHVLAGLAGIGGDAPLHLHPLAFAGWLGLFVTALNLLPLAQLDGGHVLYALRPGLQPRIGRLFLLSLLPLGLLWWGWWPWALLIVVLGRGRMAHPPLLQEGPPLDPRRRAVALACAIAFFLCFVPAPLAL